METLSRHSELEAFLKDVDYTDIKQIDANTGLREFIAGMLSYYPWWMVLLYRVREILVNLLGLAKSGRLDNDESRRKQQDLGLGIE